MQFEVTDSSKYYFETSPDDGMEGRCQHIQCLDGVSVGRCVNNALPGMWYCYIHAPREALDYEIRLLDKQIRKLKEDNNV